IQSHDPLFVNSLSNTTDETWKRLRAVVTPTFSAGKLRRMKPFVDDTIRTLLKNFEEARATNKTVNVKHIFGAFTMDTVIQVCIGHFNITAKTEVGFTAHNFWT